MLILLNIQYGREHSLSLKFKIRPFGGELSLVLNSPDKINFEFIFAHTQKFDIYLHGEEWNN